jgi:hypothetical protein
MRFVAQFFEHRLGLGDDVLVAFGLAQRDQFQRLLDFAFDAPVALDRPVESGALAQDRLRRAGIIPQARVLRLGVQLRQAAIGRFPVKDASSAAPATCECRRRPPRSQPASTTFPRPYQ